MKQENIFIESANFLNDRVLGIIRKYKDTYQLPNYKLLYVREKENVKENVNVKENGNEIRCDPYYGNKKSTSTQVMSRILRGKTLLTDKQFSIIAENMKVSKFELLFGTTCYINSEKTEMYEYTPVFGFFINKMLEEAFVSDKYCNTVIDLLKDSAQFSIYLINSMPKPKYRDIFGDIQDSQLENFENSKEKRAEMLKDSEFAEIFWNATERLLNKIDYNLCKNEYYEPNFTTISVEFFRGQNKIFPDLASSLDKFFIFCKKEFFEKYTPNIQHTSYGLLAFNLLKHEVNNARQDFLDEKEDDCDVIDLLENDLVEGFWKLKRKLALSTINYANELLELQQGIDRKIARNLKKYRLNQENLFFYGDDYFEEFEENDGVLLASSELVFQCARCRFSNIFEKEEITEKISFANSIDAPMGLKQFHTIELSKECRHCNNDLHVRIIISEYPTLCIEYLQYDDCKGGVVIKEPRIEYYSL
ncbi:hypothetical protein [Streptococcus ferus]|uniref:hypothetical protein n=1 Tax=Streptococcus ferus TaxID=1345 RepID=UPI0035A0B9B3